MYNYNQRYDRIIANATAAGQFSINFKEEFDYNIYLLIRGPFTFEEQNPYPTIYEAREVTQALIDNTNNVGNKHRAEIIMKLLDNLEKYTRRIEENKRIGGHYLDNIEIWENDVQLVTGLIQSTVLEYSYYETMGMEQIRVELTSNLQKIIFMSLIVFAFLVVVALFLSVVIPNSIVKPIHELNYVTNQVAKGDLSVQVSDLSGFEVRQLGKSLNIMIKKIDNLLCAVREDEENLREAELELLQSQINPHFLYNTLDTIIWLAESGKQEQVVEMVSALSNFFRTSLNHGNGMFTLREEEHHILSYLQIQQVRYQDILDYEINFPNALKDTIIPKITIQPLVENALYHGIKNRRGGGKIKVYATLENNDVVISVHDNGMGMTEECLEKLITRLYNRGNNTSSHQKHYSYGLYNVNERIKLKFGNKYGLSIKSKYGVGTCVNVKLPYVDPNSKNIQSD